MKFSPDILHVDVSLIEIHWRIKYPKYLTSEKGSAAKASESENIYRLKCLLFIFHNIEFFVS